MRHLLVTATAVATMTVAAHADPVRLSETQMDAVSAGFLGGLGGDLLGGNFLGLIGGGGLGDDLIGDLLDGGLLEGDTDAVLGLVGRISDQLSGIGLDSIPAGDLQPINN